MGFFALSRGYLVGTSGNLQLTHLIPVGRLDPDYLARLMRGSLDSAEQVNDKWRGVFGQDVVSYFRGSPTQELLKAVFHGARATSTNHRLLAGFHAYLARMLWRRAKG